MKIGNFIKSLLCVGGIAVVCAIVFRLGASSREEGERKPEETWPPISIIQNTPDANPMPSESRLPGARPSGAQSPDTDETPFSIPVPIDEITDTRYLELINGEYPVGKEPENGAVVSAWPTVAVSSKAVTIHGTALEAVSGLFAEARETYDGTFYIGSGYRDYETQKQIYDGASDKSYAQPPNHSEHQTGLAADIFIIGIGQYDMTGTSEALWLAGNAWKHGLILRYTKDKRNITDIADEPWHFRYIGLPHALYCYQNSLCFEEYIQYLKDSGGYHIDLNWTSYTVSYQAAEDGLIYLPENGEYHVSGDNTGGFIVTAWK